MLEIKFMKSALFDENARAMEKQLFHLSQNNNYWLLTRILATMFCGVAYTGVTNLFYRMMLMKSEPKVNPLI